MEGKQVAICATSIIVFILATAFVALYFISCVFVVRAVRLADWLMLLAWMLDFGLMFSLFYATGKGLGRHASSISPQNETGLNKAVYCFDIFYDASSIAAKNSVLIFFLGLTHLRKGFYWANYCTLFVVNVAGIALVFDTIFQCHPISARFHFETQTREHCHGIFASFISSSPFNITTDIAILVIPIPLLTRMRMRTRQKVILITTFGVAICVIAVDIIRIAFLEGTATTRLQDLHTAKVGEIPDDDYTCLLTPAIRFAAIPFMLSAVEVNITIICACVPSLKPLATRFRWILAHPSDPTKECSLQHASRGSNVRTTARNQPATIEMMDILTHRMTTQAETEEADKTEAEEARGNMTFINLLNAKPANMLKLNQRESFAPNALVSTIFFLWGFAYGPLSVLNKRFATVTDLTEWHSLGLHGAFDGGYLLGPLLIGRFVLKKFGCAATFITGLYIYGCGTLLFWPAGVLGSTPTFVVSNLMVGFGLGILETTANMFVALCGPLEYSEIRLCVAHAFEATGGLTAQLISTRVLFKHEQSLTQVVSGQWTFFVLAFCDVILAVVFYYLPIPEVPDGDLDELRDLRPANSAKLFGLPIPFMTLALGVWSQYFYVAGQELHNLSYSSDVPSEFTSISTAAFIGGRLLAAVVIWLFLKPRWTLLISYVGMIVFAVLRMNTTGTAATAMGALLWTFEGAAFPIIYGIALRGTGRHTKTASAFLAAAISGGLFFPFIKYAVQLARGEAYSYCVVVAVFCAGAIFPMYLNSVPKARRQVDPIKGEYLHR